MTGLWAGHRAFSGRFACGLRVPGAASAGRRLTGARGTLGARSQTASACVSSACKAVRRVRGSPGWLVQVRSSEPTTVVRASSLSIGSAGLPGWLPCGPPAADGVAPRVRRAASEAELGSLDRWRPRASSVEPKEVFILAKILALLRTSRDHPAPGDNDGPLGAHSARDEKMGHG